MTNETALAHHTAEVNGVRLHCVTAGAGDPVVLLHGWPQTWHEWRHLIPVMASRYTVVAPDLRGFGDSDKPASGYDKRTVAEDIRQLVRHLGLREIDLVGHDIGMMVAYGLRRGTSPGGSPARRRRGRVAGAGARRIDGRREIP
jgi:pimeloyl-ACP methyl ester carboxylesterase